MNIFDKLPVELYGEEGPTGSKEKNDWVGDDRGQLSSSLLQTLPHCLSLLSVLFYTAIE